jgi:hypothetical protein
VAKYGNVTYGGTKYGETPKLVYSVEPMSLVVLDFSKVYLQWISPTGTFSKIRLVRNQWGFPETAEDGVIIWDEFATSGNVSRQSFVDGLDNPTSIGIVPGKPVYYSMFLYNDQKVWVTAGKIQGIVALNHNTQNKIMDLIPKVYTSKEQSPLHVTDETSALYNFMYALSFSYDEFLTLIELTQPNHTKEGSPFSVLSEETGHVGLDPEPNLPVKNQKRLVRESRYLYSHKGLKNGLETYAESLTGYAPTVTVSPNLLLSVQDSTFYQSIGNWLTSQNLTATSNVEQVAELGENVIDMTYSCKLIATDASTSMFLGFFPWSPITRGIPVKSETEYIVSCKVKSPPSDGNVSLVIGWFDGTGAPISETAASTTSANNTWKTVSKTATAPSTAVYAGIKILYSDAGTYYVDQVCMQEGNTINYDEARAITVELSPNKINYIKNPSFEVDASNWATTGATFTQDSNVPTFGYTGDYSGKFVAAGLWDLSTSYNIPVTPGQYYTGSFYVSSDDASTINCSIEFYNIDDELINTIEAVDQPISDTFSQITVTGISDSLLEATYAIFRVSGTAGTFYIDLIQFEKSFVATEYFDGSMPSNYGNVWQGTANSSYTLAYYNKPLKLPRLAETMKDWIPQNAFWRIKTLAGLEYTNPTM